MPYQPDLVLGGPNLEYLTPAEAAKEVAGVYGVNAAATPKFYTGNEIAISNAQQARFYIPVRIPSVYYNRTSKGRRLDRALNRAIMRGVKNFEEKGIRSKKKDPNFSQRAANVRNQWNASQTDSQGYIDFILNNFSIQYRELHQVSDLLSDSFAAYFSGQAAPMASMSGYLLNTRQNNWADLFEELYQRVIRGTIAARNNYAIKLRLDSREYTLGITNLSISFQSQTESAKQFSLQAIVHKNKLITSQNGIYTPTVWSRLEKFADRLAITGSASGVEQVNNVKTPADYPAQGTVAPRSALASQFNLQNNAASVEEIVAGGFTPEDGRQATSLGKETIQEQIRKSQAESTDAEDVFDTINASGATGVNLPA